MLLWWLGCTPKVDEQFLDVVQTSPDDGSTSVALDTPITARFDGPVEEETLRPDTFAFSPGVVGAYQVDGDLVTFIPSGPLRYSVEYTATLSPEIRDLDGRVLLGGYRFSFHTRGRSWGDAEALWPASAGTVLEWAAFASNAAGESVSLIVANQEDQSDLRPFHTVDGTWQLDAAPLDSHAQGIRGLAVGNDARNGAIAVWLVDDELRWARLGPAGWSAPRPLSTGTSAVYERHPGVLTTPDGSSLAWHLDLRGGADTVLANLYDAGWQDERTVGSAPGGTIAWVDAARKPDGEALVYWLANDELWAAHGDIAGEWDSPIALADEGVLQARAVALPGEQWLALWQDEVGLRFRVGSAEGDWGPTRSFLRAENADLIEFELAGGPQSAMLVWSEASDPDEKTWRSARFVNGFWEDELPFDADGPIWHSFFRPRIAANANGEFLAAWTLSSPTECTGMRSAHFWPESGWEIPKPASETCAWIIGLTLTPGSTARLLGVAPGTRAPSGEATGLYTASYE